MLFNKMNDCCTFVLGALDGLYGWISEAIAIVVIVFVFNFLVKWLLKRLHLHFENQKKYWKDSFVQALYLPLSYYVWFFAILETIDLVSSKLMFPIPIENRHILLAIGAVLAFTWFLLRWKGNVVKHLITQSKNREIAIDQGKIGAIDKLLTVIIIFFTGLLLLEATDRSMNTIIAFGGVGGLALAFASQEVIANFFGGFMIYLTQPFTIGDWISIPDHSIEGIVEEIGWYMTRVRSLDKRPIYIPNSIFSRLIVITPSRMSHRVFKVILALRTEDLPKIKKIMEEIKDMLQQHFDIDHSQTVLVRLSAFGTYSLDITISACIPIIDNEGFMKVQEDLLLKIADIIGKNGAEFATPVQNLEWVPLPGKPTDVPS